MTRRLTTVRAVVAVLAVASSMATAACADDDPSASTQTSTEASAAPSTSSAVGDTSVPATTTPSDSTSDPSSAPSSTDAPTTTEPPHPTTTIHQPPATCDQELDAMLAVVEESIAGSRLAEGGTWSVDTAGSPFDDRTHTAEEFRYRLGLDCSARLSHQASDGAQRLVVAAWTGDRRAWVVQATDGPSTPYRPDQRVQLFIDQPYGEWLVDQYVWAGSLTTGETVIVGTVDTSFGVAAKSWWSEVERFDDLEVTNAAERYAIDTLVHAGARNVSVAEPADFRSEVAAIQFITPLGLHLIATIAPPDWFDPAAPIVEGDMVVEQLGGVEVYVTTAVPESYAVASVGWTCGDYVWFVDAAYGTVDELTDWTAALIESAGC